MPSYTYALTAICNLTGYLRMTPIPDKKTSTIAVQLFSEIFLNSAYLGCCILTTGQSLN